MASCFHKPTSIIKHIQSENNPTGYSFVFDDSRRTGNRKVEVVQVGNDYVPALKIRQRRSLSIGGGLERFVRM